MHGKENSWTNMLLSAGSSSEKSPIGNSMLISVVSPPSTSSDILPTTPGSANIYPYITFPGNQWSEKWWKRKVFYFLFGLIIGMTGVILWHCTYAFFTHEHLQPNTGECVTPTCMKAAARILARYSDKYEPCQDFYGFSCGKFVAENEIPDDSFTRSTLQEMQESILTDIKKLIEGSTEKHKSVAVEKAKQLYYSCMHNSFRTSHYSDYKFLPIFSVLQSGGVGQWPILQGTHWNQSEYSLERLLAQLFAHQVQNIFELYVTPDEIDSSKYLLEFDKGKPAILKTFFLNTTNNDYIRYVRSYKRLLLESVLILSHGKQGSPKVTQDVDDIIEFESNFAKLVESSKCHFDGFDILGGEEDYGRVTLGDIQDRIPHVNWTTLVQYIFDNLGLKENVSSEMIVYFHCSEFFPGLVSLIEQSDSRTVTNYLIWRFVFRYLPYLGNKFLQIWMEFMKDVPQSNANEERLHLSRWKQCASIVNDGFGMAMAHLYVQQSYKKSIEKTVREMILYLKKAFRQVIIEQEWLSDQFKVELIEKLMNMGDKIGYPPYIMRAKALDKEYDGLQFNESSFLLNILKMRKFEVVKEIRKVQRRVDLDKDWYIQPLVANAFHNPTANEIVIPLGILRYPMFDENYPMYLNFANLGIVLGHEMTHGFDHQGRHYDKDGNFTSWWPDDVQIAFRNQAICFADQYGKFKMPLVDQFVDGNDTLADNVCDNAALRHSWLAYQMWAEDHNVEEPLLPGLNFTIPQIFYMTFGQIWCEVLNKEGYQQYVRDTHSPGQFRAWGVAQNNIYFDATDRLICGWTLHIENILDNAAVPVALLAYEMRNVARKNSLITTGYEKYFSW
ncbi:unnamed protein product [Allacma fusca]|uniref:Uncharacterized protein n=1 Tax=Allacma fusca TaxID=39272 RepID=A0A8J2KCB4_9HEXA|nr:unnamed protein product [Allacma fusca]